MRYIHARIDIRARNQFFIHDVYKFNRYTRLQ